MMLCDEGDARWETQEIVERHKAHAYKKGFKDGALFVAGIVTGLLAGGALWWIL